MTKRSLGKFVAVALHPTIDRTVEVPRLVKGGVIRGRLLMLEAGGKGTNVAHTLSNLGQRVVMTGFLNRRDRGFFLSSFGAGRVKSDWIMVEAATRETMTVVSREDGSDTHIIGGAMRIRAAELVRLRVRLPGHVRKGDCAVFSGSCPAGVRQKDYLDLMRACRERGGRLCVDTSGGALRAAVKLKPWLIKPNADELAELTGGRVRTMKQVLAAGREALALCSVVLASLGEKGAVLLTREGAWHARETRRARVVHTVGCGDALLAGFLSAHAQGKAEPEALRFGVACGSACVRSRYACVRSKAEAKRALGKVTVTEL